MVLTIIKENCNRSNYYLKIARDEGLMFEASAKHHLPQVKNIPFLISTFVDQTHIQCICPCRKTGFFKTSLPVFTHSEGLTRVDLGEGLTLKGPFVCNFGNIH